MSDNGANNNNYREAIDFGGQQTLASARQPQQKQLHQQQHKSSSLNVESMSDWAKREEIAKRKNLRLKQVSE